MRTMEQEEMKKSIMEKTSVNDIHISRVPKNIKRWFIDYAHDKFCGDYGLCLKHVVDMYRGMTPVGYDELQGQIDELKLEIDQLKIIATDSQNKKKRRMADGTVIE